jgi:hypothetical protein
MGLRLKHIRMFQNLARGAKALNPLRNTAIYGDDMNYCADFVGRDVIADRATAVQFPFRHLAERPNHGEVHHGSGFGVDGVIAS